jgi:uncharacterized protein YndB with AHSA1/START domain
MMGTADGTLETREDGKAVIRFKRRFSHPIERVWEALTDRDHVIRWWGDLDAELVPGGRFVLRWLNSDEGGNTSVWNGTVAEIDPPRALETSGSWGASDSAWEAATGTLRWELTPDGDETVLRFVNTVELPEEFKTKTLAGWHWHLDALADVLDGRPGRDLASVEGWEPIHETYVAEFSAG